MTLAARIVLYDPDGPRSTVSLTDPVSWDASFAFNDVGALSVSYASLLEGAALLENPFEIAAQLWDGSQWVEPRNGRFVSSEDSSDPSRDFDVPTFAFRSYASLLDRAQVVRSTTATASRYDSDGKRNFLSASPGQVLLSVLNEARSLYPGLLPALALDFTASKDSLGNSWTALVSVAYEPGMSMLDVLRDLAAYGQIDWWLEGRRLRVVNAGAAQVDRKLRLNLTDVRESPVRGSWEGMYTHIRVEGKDGRVWERPVPGAVVPHGTKIKTIANDSISTDGTALSLIEHEIILATRKRTEYTRSIATFDVIPGLDYQLGDTVGALNAFGQWEQQRIFEFGLEWEADGERAVTLDARVTLNDRFVDASVRAERARKGITHGATQTMGDGGIPSRSDRAIPAAPVGVTANSLGYWQDVIPLSSVDVSWQAVTADVDGLALNGVDYYEVTCGGQTKRAADTSVGFDELQPSRIYEVRVRAISSTGIRGRWSTTHSVTTAYPLPNLDPPTAPILTTENGALSIVWDGTLKGTGSPYLPPKHFSHVLVEVQKVGASAWTRYERDQGTVLVGLVMGEQWRARLVAVDVLGRESSPGPASTVTVKSEAQKAQEKANEAAEVAADAKAKAEKAVSDVFDLSSDVNAVAGQARDAWNQAISAQDVADTAVKAAENLFPWTTAWVPGPGGHLVKDTNQIVWDGASEPTYANRAHCGSGRPLPAGKNYRITAVVSVVGDTPGRFAMVFYRNKANGSYSSSLWPPNNTHPIPADGKQHVVTTVAKNLVFGSDESLLNPVFYCHDAEGMIVHDVRVIDSTVADEAQDAAEAAMATAVRASDAAADAKKVATSAQTAANGKNTIFRSTGVPGSTKGTAVNDVWWRFRNASYTGPIIGQWTWSGSAWVASTIGSEIIEALTVDKLSVTGAAKMPVAVINQFMSDDAFVRNLYSSRIIVASDNIAVDPYMDVLARWRTNTATAQWSTERPYPGHTNSMKFTQLPKGSSNMTLYSITYHGLYSESGTPVEPGQKYVARAWWYATAKMPADGGGYSTQVYFYDENNNLISNQSAGGKVLPGSEPVGEWFTTGGGVVTAPAGAVAAMVRPTIYFNASVTPNNAVAYLGKMELKTQVGAILIEDGVITAPKIATSAVETDHLKAGLLDAFRIRSPLFESVATANRGIKWVGDQFVAYNNAGKEMFRLSGNTGEISGMTITGGVVRTAASGERIWMGLRNDNLPGIEFYDATRRRVSYGFSTGKDPGIWMYDASGAERLRLNSTGSMTMFAPNGIQSISLTTENDSTYGRAWLQGPAYGSYRPRIMLGRATVDGTVTSIAEIQGGSGNSDASWLRVSAGGSWWLGSSTRGRIQMDNSSGELSIYPRSNLLSFYNLPATTSSGQWITMIVSASGRPSIYRNTSLRAAKTNIVDLGAVLDVDRLMDLRPRIFHDRTAWDEYAKGLEASQLQRDGLTPSAGLEIWEGTAKPRPIIGLIAEEVVEIFPELASWDGAGNLSGVQYDRLPELILAWLQKHMPAITDRITRIENHLHIGESNDHANQY